jgi:glycosyltransferase involved in cell wall biosynthesis
MSEGVEYEFSTGGVTRMVYPLLRKMVEDGTVEDAQWVSLNPSGPPVVKANGITFHHVALPSEKLAGYGAVKEAIWGTVHGVQSAGAAMENVFWTDEFSEFTYYNRVSAELMAKLDDQHDFDLFYIHDFQQLPVGKLLETLKPKIFRWHIPFDETMIPIEWKELLATYFNSYDTVIASSGKYLDALKSFGHQGRVRKVYPFVDSREFSVPSKEEVDELSRRLGIGDEDIVALTVARMDPMKGQDRAIRAVASSTSKFENIKLVFVGNGSFSGSVSGLSLSKGQRWREELESRARKLGLENKVIFAGHLSQKDLDSIYERCNFTVLPSVKEGFGLVVVESWLHHKPAIVTDQAGVAELIEDGKNGLLFDPNDSSALTNNIALLYDDSELCKKMGDRGFETSAQCSMEEGVKAEKQVIAELVGD